MNMRFPFKNRYSKNKKRYIWEVYLEDEKFGFKIIGIDGEILYKSKLLDKLYDVIILMNILLENPQEFEIINNMVVTHKKKE